MNFYTNQQIESDRYKDQAIDKIVSKQISLQATNQKKINSANMSNRNEDQI